MPARDTPVEAAGRNAEEWNYVRIRRLLIFVERSLDEGTQWAVFEPNGPPLWTRLRADVETILRRLWRSGDLKGAKPEEAFFVRCDETTMTQADIDDGRLIVEIGFAPVRPAEFVIFRILRRTAEPG